MMSFLSRDQVDEPRLGSFGILCLLATVGCCGAVDPVEYRIGYWVPGRPMNYLDPVWRYLNQEAQTWHPPAAFTPVPIEYNSELPQLEEVFGERTIDFAVLPPLHQVCMSARYHNVVLATMDDGVDAVSNAVVVTRSGNNEISTLTDLRGKRVGGFAFYTLLGWVLQVLALEAFGINVYIDLKMTAQYYTRATGVQPYMDALLSGELDAGFIPRQTISAFSAEDQFKIIELPKDKVSFSIPGVAVSVLEHVEEEVHLKMIQALTAMNRSDPVVNTVYEFSTARSYDATRNAAVETGTMRLEDGQWTCLDEPELYYDAITCPEGYAKLPMASVEKGCQEQKQQCPSGGICLCSPCIKGVSVVVTASNSLSASGKVCEKMSVCGVTEQLRPLEIHVEDILQRKESVVKYKLYDDVTTLNDTVSSKGTATLLPGSLHAFNLTTEVSGLLVLEIVFNDEQVDASPLRIRVQRRVCPEAKQIAAEDGKCECESGSLSVGGECTSALVFVLAILMPIVALIMFCLAFGIWYQRLRANSVWKIDRKNLTLLEPQEVLGHGAYGLVIKGIYRGTEVAVKQAFHKKDDTASSRVSELDDTIVSQYRPTSWQHDFGLPVSQSPRATTGHNLPGNRASQLKEILESQMGNDAHLEDEADGRDQGDEFSLTISDQPTQPTVSLKQEPESDVTSPELRHPEKSFHSRPMGSGSPTRSLDLGREEDNDCGQPGFRDDGSFRRSQSSPCERAALPSIKTTSLRKSRSLLQRALTPLGSVFDFSLSSARARSDFIHEIKTMARMRHPNIVTVIGAVMDKNEVLLVMELMGNGSLFDFYCNELMSFEGEMIHSIFEDIALGMDYLHSHDPVILHGDLKASNVLVDSKFRAKVSDFGIVMSKRKLRGTVFWMSPEILAGDPATVWSDVYAYGVTLCEVLARKQPFQGLDVQDTKARIMDPVTNLRPRVPDASPQILKNLIQQCFLSTPEHRPTFKTIRGLLQMMNHAQYLVLWPRQARVEMNPQALSLEILMNHFPKHVAEAFVKGENVSEDRKDCATVVFAEIANWKKTREPLDEEQTNNLLERMRKKVATIAHVHGIHLLETIGEKYVGVTNLVEQQDADHVARMARFSLGIVQAAGETMLIPTDPCKGTLSLSVGFDSGPMVGNVVGTHDRKYTVVGNTVNVASRVAKCAMQGVILCTERAGELLQDQDKGFVIKNQGKCLLRNSGAVSTKIQVLRVHSWGIPNSGMKSRLFL